MYFRYDKGTFKINGVFTNEKGITLGKYDNIKKINTDNLSQTDIRAYNEDGTVKSIEQQVKEKIVILKKNEIIKDGEIVELNMSIEDDLIIMIERGLAELPEYHKIIEVDRKKRIAMKSIEDLYETNIINKETYNNEMINRRRSLYQTQVDGMRDELLDKLLSRLELTEDEQSILENIEKAKQKIKTEYKKI